MLQIIGLVERDPARSSIHRQPNLVSPNRERNDHERVFEIERNRIRQGFRFPEQDLLRGEVDPEVRPPEHVHSDDRVDSPIRQIRHDRQGRCVDRSDAEAADDDPLNLRGLAVCRHIVGGDTMKAKTLRHPGVDDRPVRARVDQRPQCRSFDLGVGHDQVTAPSFEVDRRHGRICCPRTGAGCCCNDCQKQKTCDSDHGFDLPGPAVCGPQYGRRKPELKTGRVVEDFYKKCGSLFISRM